MIDFLKRNEDSTFNLVSESEIITGDEFDLGWDSVNKKPIIKTVTQIHEQRKERGTYDDESKRRMWAKVSAN